MLNPLAQELNHVLQDCPISKLLSPFGQRIFFPRGIISQGAEAKKYGTKANATIGMTVNDHHPLILSAVQAELPNLTPEQAVSYAPTAGNIDLRNIWKEKIIKKNPTLKNKSFSLPVVVPGLTAGISYLCDLFLNEGDTLIAGDPSWDNYNLIVEARNNAILRQFSMFTESTLNGKFNIQAFKDTVEDEAKKGVVKILLNFPQNPSGYSPTKKEAAEICSIIKNVAEKGAYVLVCCDDAYFGLDYEPEIESESLFAYLADIHQNVVAVKNDGPTKEDYVWGFRCGFMTFAGKGITEAHQEAIVKKLMGTIRSSVSCCNTPAQSILLKLFTDPNLEQEKATCRNILEGRYRKAKAFIEKQKDHKVLQPLPFNSGYFMSFLCIGINAEDLRQKLLHEHGVGTIAIDENHLRIAFSSLDKRDIDEVYTFVYDVAEELSRKSAT